MEGPIPIVQVLKHRDERRLVAALPQSAILISQEWITTVAGWAVIADSRDGVSQILVYTSTRGDPRTLSMKNGLPYLSKELVWQAMEAIASKTTLVSGHPWPELREMIHEQVQRTRPKIHAVHEVVPTPTPPVQVSSPKKSVRFDPNQARQEIMRLVEENQPRPNANRWRPSGVAKSLTLGAQTGRGSDNGVSSCNRTHEPKHAKLIQLVHQLAQSVVDIALPCLGFQILTRARTSPEPA